MVARLLAQPALIACEKESCSPPSSASSTDPLIPTAGRTTSQLLKTPTVLRAHSDRHPNHPNPYHTTSPFAIRNGRFVDSSGGKSGDGGGGGSKCETGYLHLDPSELRRKRNVEFGAPTDTNRHMPGVGTLLISVIYAAAEAEDAWLLNATLPTVMEKFPGALEVVVVVRDKASADAYGQVIGSYKDSAPFNLKLVYAADTAAGWEAVEGGRSGVANLFPLLAADKFCSGRFVLHLDPDSVLLERVTYDHIFHFGKPVIPFTRFSGEGERKSEL